MAWAWSGLAQTYFAAGLCGLSAIWWGRLKLRVSQSSGSAKAHGQLKLMDAQAERPLDSTELSEWAEWYNKRRATFTIQDIGRHASAHAMKEILCLFEISVLMSYWFMWLICKNNSPKNPFPFKLCFLLPTTMLWVQTGLLTPQTSYFQPEQHQI